MARMQSSSLVQASLLPVAGSHGTSSRCPCKTGWATSALRKHRRVLAWSGLAPAPMHCLLFLLKMARIWLERWGVEYL